MIYWWKIIMQNGLVIDLLYLNQPLFFRLLSSRYSVCYQWIRATISWAINSTLILGKIQFIWKVSKDIWGYHWKSFVHSNQEYSWIHSSTINPFTEALMKEITYAFNHSHKKQKDSLEGSLDQVLFEAELEFSKIKVPRPAQHTSNVNTECARKSEWSKQLYSLYLTSFLEHCIWICF